MEEESKTLRLMIANQKGGVAKTTTAIALARFAADRGMRVLLIDCDPQSSVAEAVGAVLGKNSLHQFLVDRLDLTECTVEIHPNINLLASSRRLSMTEAMLNAQAGKELIFDMLLPPAEQDYDFVLIDVAPSINLFQTAGMIYTRRLLLPMSMDIFSLQGGNSSIQSAEELSRWFKRDIRALAILPVLFDKRYAMTRSIMASIDVLGAKHHIPVLSPIPTDSTANKATRMKKFLVDFDPTSKIVKGYNAAFEQLFEILKPKASQVTEGHVNEPAVAAAVEEN